MNPYLLLILIFLAALLQTAVAPFIHFNHLHPDWVALIVLAVVLQRPFRDGVLVAFVAGIMLDLLSGTPFGMFTSAMMLMAIGAAAWHGRIASQTVIVPVLLAFPYTVLYNLVLLAWLQLQGQATSLLSALVQVILPMGIINTVVMAVVYVLLLWLHRFEQKPTFEF